MNFSDDDYDADVPEATDDWTPVDDASEPAERIDFDDLAFIAEVTHPVRGLVLRRLKEPHTVAEVAGLLDVPVTRLYHHVNRLEAVGLIRVVATRQVGSATERRYQVTARGYGIDPTLLQSSDPADLSVGLGALFDFAKLGLQREIETGSFDIGSDLDTATLSLGALVLTDARRRELVVALNEVIEEFVSDTDEDDPDAVPFNLFVAGYPTT